LSILELRTWAELLQAIVTTIAILVGGVWTYFRFVRNRLFFPRAEVNHEILHKDLIDGKKLLRVTMTVSNKGDVLIPISEVWTRVSQISPVIGPQLENITSGNGLEMEDTSEILWPEIGCLQIDYSDGEAEIEPGESENFPFDFIVDSEVKTVRIYSYFQNNRKTNSGWAITSLIDI